MPISLPPISRRRFLATGALAAGAGLFPRCLLASEEPADPNTFALLADIHICQDRDRENRAVRPVPAFEQVSGEILALPKRPATAIVAGDCAFREGLPGDYAMLGSLLKPLRRAGMSVHLTLGNHDHRANFRAAFPDAMIRPAEGGDAPDKLVAVVETPLANWFLLDSLDKTNVTPGLLGDSQRAWLAKALDARPDKPALVVAHHNPDGRALPSGLVDMEALFDVLLPKRQVKAFVFGHSHQWRIDRRDDLHLVNVPAVVWTFDPVQPRGYVSARLRRDGATLSLQALDRKHSDHGEPIELPWRA